MNIISIFTYHDTVRELFKKFINIFEFNITEGNTNITFSSKNLKIDFVFLTDLYSSGINYYISYFNNKEKKYIYNEIFWKNFERTTKFWYMHDADKRDLDDFITNYATESWSYNSLMSFINFISSRVIADIIGNDFFYNKRENFEFEKYHFENSYFMQHIFNEYKKYSWEEYKSKEQKWIG